MDFATPLRLPVIDFSKKDLKPDTELWESVKSQVREALEEYGCFEALFNKVPAELRNGIISAMEELFELPLQTKLRNFSENPFFGYIGQHHQDHAYSYLKDEAPLYESLGFVEANISQKVDSLTSVLWPQGNPTFSKTIQSFSEEVSELDQIVRRMIVESLGLGKYMEENSTTYLLRVMKYEGPETSEKKLGLLAHTDKTTVSILHQNEVNGLEVRTKDGEWINMEVSSPASFVVMIGDFIHAWTNGILRAPHHRVMMNGNKARYSAGLFSIPKADYIIKAPEELIDEDHPLLFRPFVYAEYLKLSSLETFLRDESPLKTF